MRKNQNKPGLNKLAGDIKGIYKRYRHGFYRPNLLLTLEKRQMFDGAAGALVADDLMDIAGQEEQLPTPDASPTNSPVEGPTLTTEQEVAQQADAVAEEQAANTESSIDEESAITDETESEISNVDSDGEASSDVVDEATDESEEERAAEEEVTEEQAVGYTDAEAKRAAPEIVQADILAEDALTPTLPTP